jgi:hypothetical protein
MVKALWPYKSTLSNGEGPVAIQGGGGGACLVLYSARPALFYSARPGLVYSARPALLYLAWPGPPVRIHTPPHTPTPPTHTHTHTTCFQQAQHSDKIDYKSTLT